MLAHAHHTKRDKFTAEHVCTFIVSIVENLRGYRCSDKLVKIVWCLHLVIIDKTVRVVGESGIYDLPRKILVEEVTIAVKHCNTDNTHEKSENESTKGSVRVLGCGILVERMILIVFFKLF